MDEETAREELDTVNGIDVMLVLGLFKVQNPYMTMSKIQDIECFIESKEEHHAVGKSHRL